MKEGIPLPCRITVNSDRSYELIIHQPSSTFLLMQAAGMQKGAMEGGMQLFDF
jgi:large subunit ribosomal protein L11